MLQKNYFDVRTQHTVALCKIMLRKISFNVKAQHTVGRGGMEWTQWRRTWSSNVVNPRDSRCTWFKSSDDDNADDSLSSS